MGTVKVDQPVQDMDKVAAAQQILDKGTTAAQYAQVMSTASKLAWIQ